MQKIAILNEASRAVLSTFDLDQVLNQILEIARDHFSLKNGAVILLDVPTQELRTRAWMGDYGEQVDVPLHLGQGLVGTAAKLRSTVYSPYINKARRHLQKFLIHPHQRNTPLLVPHEQPVRS